MIEGLLCCCDETPGRTRAEIDANDHRIRSARAIARQFVGASNNSNRPVAARKVSRPSKVKRDRSSARSGGIEDCPDDDAAGR